MKNIDKKKLYMIIGIMLLILSLSGSAYAYFSATAVAENSISGTAAGGADLDLDVVKISTGANSDLIPLDNTTEMLTKAVIGYNNDSKENNKRCIDKNGYTVCQVYKITITNNSSIPVTLNGGVTLSGTNTPNIECAVMDNINTVTNNKSCKGNKTLANKVTLNGSASKDYYIIVYIKNIEGVQTDSGGFNGTIFFNVNGDKIETKFNETAAEYITNLYEEAEKSTVTNNSITYNTAPSVSLMNDRLGGTTTSLDGGNIRYYGASPNNYIYFNCSDYSNQTSDTCELWRIIGVFNGKVKIIRNESIGEYSWDTSVSTVNNGTGVNEWSQADLMKLLNPGYESETIGGSLYYNSGSGTCYNGSKNSLISCNFTSTGIKNDVTRNKIETVTWNTGGWNTSGVYSNVMYEKERGTSVISNPSDGITRQTTWSGKIALAYPSDYGYATDFTQCSKTLNQYNSSDDSYACRSNDWMYPILGTSSYGWLLAPYSGRASFVWGVYSAGRVSYNDNAFVAYGVAPVLYLGSDAILESGTGLSSEPYKLG